MRPNIRTSSWFPEHRHIICIYISVCNIHFPNYSGHDQFFQVPSVSITPRDWFRLSVERWKWYSCSNFFTWKPSAWSLLFPMNFQFPHRLDSCLFWENPWLLVRYIILSRYIFAISSAVTYILRFLSEKTDEYWYSLDWNITRRVRG